MGGIKTTDSTNLVWVLGKDTFEFHCEKVTVYCCHCILAYSPPLRPKWLSIESAPEAHMHALAQAPYSW